MTSYRDCFDHLDAAPVTIVAAVGDLLDRPRTDDAATRAHVKGALVDNCVSSNSRANSVAARAKEIIPLVALRLRIEILRNARCPTVAELDTPPYAALRAPSILGNSIPVTPIDHALRVDPPAWVRDEIDRDCKTRKPPFPPCSPSKIISLPCP